MQFPPFSTSRWLVVLLPALGLFGVGCGEAPGPLPAGQLPESRRSIFRGQIYTHQVVDGWAIAQGDVILGRADRLEVANEETLGHHSELVTIDGAQFRWPNGVVPYDLPVLFPYRSIAQAAIDHWNTQLNGTIRLVPRTNETDYVQFQQSDMCASYVGRAGGAQPIWQGPSCQVGNIIHELGHVMGAYHEQARIDRDQHVRIVWQNVQPGTELQFQKTSESDGTDIGAYDYGSVMHYDAYAYSVNGLPTIETIPVGIPIGQRLGLSNGDIAGVRSIYGGSAPVLQPPSITSQPQALTITQGGTATFSVTASGTAPLTYQWVKDGQLISGATQSTITLTNVPTSYAGMYWVRVSNSAGNAESNHVGLTVNASGPTQPPGGGGGGGALTNGVPVTNLSGSTGSELRFSIAVPAGATTASFQISGGSGDADLYVSFNSQPTTSVYGCAPYLEGNNETCTDPQPSAGTYYILVRGYSAFSGVRLVASYGGGGTGTGTAPTITAQPDAASVQNGANVLFRVTATGTGPLAYQWYKDGVVVSGATSSQLALTAVQPSQAGTYWVGVSNSAGSVESNHVGLIVSTPPAGPAGTLTNGVPVEGLSGAAGSELQFTLDVPANATQLSFRLSGGTGDADLYVRLGSAPSGYTADCISGSSSNDEACTSQYPPAGKYYVAVRAYSTFSGARLVASYSVGNTQPPSPNNPPGQDLTLSATTENAGGNYNTVVLAWPAVSGAEYYKVFRDGVWVAVVYQAGFRDAFLAFSFSHTYQVIAIFGGQPIATSPLVTATH